MTSTPKTTYRRLVACTISLALSGIAECFTGYDALRNGFGVTANVENAGRTRLNQSGVMGRLLYYRHWHVVLHIVVDNRFL